MNLLRKNLSGGVRGVLAGLFFMCLVFGLSNRVGVVQPFMHHCLTVVSDHYYLLYAMLPLFLLMCFFVMEDDGEVVVLRHGTYFRYFTRKWLSLSVITLAFMAAQLLAAAISGLGLPMESSRAVADGSPMRELYPVFSSTFDTPALAFAAVCGYMYAGLCVVALFLMWLGHFASKPSAIKAMITLYLLSVLGIKIGFVRELPLTLLGHVVILHHNLTSPARMIITAATATVLVCIILWTVKKHWNRQLLLSHRPAKGITPYYCKELISRKNVIIMGTVVVLMVAWKYLQSAGDLSGEEWTVGLFAGHGTGSFHVPGFIEMLLLNGTPVYLLAAFIEKATTEHSAFITIRLKKRREILGGILTATSVFVLLYGFFLMAIPMITFILRGLSLDDGVLSLLSLSVILKLLDIVAQTLFVIAIYCLMGQITAGFIGLIAASLLCIAPFNLTKYLPFGISSLSRINLPQIGAEGILSTYAMGILFVTSVLFVVWLFSTGYKHLPKN
jgi:hypothetical protein